MIYDIYFHNDFDGRAAAAVMLDFLRSRGNDVEHFVPLGYELQDQYLKENFFTAHKLFEGRRNPAIVVDFSFHPKAAWWFDHHPTAFKRDDWKKRYLVPFLGSLKKNGGRLFSLKNHKNGTKYRFYNPEFESCCGQVAAILQKEFNWKPAPHFRDLIKWGDLLDGARYKSAREVVELGSIGVQVDAFIDRYAASAQTGKKLVVLMATKPISYIAKMPAVRRAVAAVRKTRAASLAYHEKHLQIFDEVGYIDLSQSDPGKNRYAGYYLLPSLMYMVRILRKAGSFQVSVGQNPWRRDENKVNIGELMKQYGGGGHPGVGATEMKTKKAAEKAAMEIVEYLKNRSK